MKLDKGLTVEEHAKTQEALQERLHSLNIDPIGIFKDVLDDKLSTYFRNKIDDLIEKSLTKKGNTHISERAYTEIKRKNLQEGFSTASKTWKDSEDFYINDSVLDDWEANDIEAYNNYRELEQHVDSALYYYMVSQGMMGIELMGMPSQLIKEKAHIIGKPYKGIMRENICLRKYPANGYGFGRPHYDYFNNGFRMLAAILYLNDVKKGGETIFPILNKKIAPKKGSLLFFPSHHTHVHYGNRSNEDKYIITIHVCNYPINDKHYHLRNENGVKELVGLRFNKLIKDED